MDDALLVRGLERVSDLAGDGEGVRERETSLCVAARGAPGSVIKT
jgi:hypothetical protein